QRASPGVARSAWRGAWRALLVPAGLAQLLGGGDVSLAERPAERRRAGDGRETRIGAMREEQAHDAVVALLGGTRERGPAALAGAGVDRGALLEQDGGERG